MNALALSAVAAFQWVLPPGTIKTLDQARGFEVEPNGALCLLAGPRTLFFPADGLLLTADAPIDEALWLSNGDLIVRSGRSLGQIQIARRKDGKPGAAFRKLLDLPFESWRLFPGAGGSFFVLGRGADGLRRLSRWIAPALPGSAPQQPLYATDAPIAAVAGDPSVAYLASGRAIYRLDAGRSEAEVVFVHPSADIRELAYVPGSGLYFAAGDDAGRAAPRPTILAHAHGARIRATARALYVLLEKPSQGILRMTLRAPGKAPAPRPAAARPPAPTKVAPKPEPRDPDPINVDGMQLK